LPFSDDFYKNKTISEALIFCIYQSTLIKISGIPMLEEKADKKWGGQEDYERYKMNTPVLIPRAPQK
jgi:steroid 5-alpha reductase family enzyme